MSSTIEETYGSPVKADDEIDLLAIIHILWRGKITVVATIIIAAVLSVFLALYLPNIYRASAFLVPIESNSTSQLAGLAQRFSAFTGNNLGLGKGEISKTAIALETLKSRKFLTSFIKKHNILIPLMAAKKWNKGSDAIIYDDSIYNSETKQWALEIKGAPPGTPPSDWMAHERFGKILNVTTDDKSGFVTISIDFVVPELASQWVAWLVHDINQYSKEKEIRNAQNGIHYLKTQLSKTTVVEIKNIFYQLIQEQVKRGLLAKTRDEYILETIDPAVTPEKKVSPKRALIVVIGTFLGGIFGILIVLVRHSISGGRRKQDA